MLSIIWMLINLAVLVLFIILVFKAAKLIRQKFGLVAAIFFGLCFLSFVTNSDDNNNLEKPNKSFSSQFSNSDELLRASKTKRTVILDNRGTYKIKLGIVLGYSTSQSTTVPVDAYTTVDGMISGQTWRANHISIDVSDGKKINFTVEGSIQWNLLGTSLYLQTKMYKGSVSIE